MIILFIQCVYTLYNGTSEQGNYNSINMTIRTSVASIFGYFLSGNFLLKEDEKNKKKESNYSLQLLERLLEDETVKENLKCEIKAGSIDCKIDVDQKEEVRVFCNRNLQSVIAIVICIIAIIILVIGINFEIIPESSIIAIAQFRDLISGCIGFLLGNPSKK